jgi:hypothetical protein
VPYLYYDSVSSQLAKKDIATNAMSFMAPPPGLNVVRLNISRFVSETWLERNAASKTIESTFEFIHQLCLSKAYDVKLEIVDIKTLSPPSKQVLTFLMNLKRSPTNDAFNSFHYVK